MFLRIQTLLAVIAMGLVLCADDAQAGFRRIARMQAAAPTPAVAAPGAEAVMLNNCYPPPCCPPPCCPPVCISYRDRTCRNVCCDPCLPNIKTEMVVCDPCTGCPVPVEVCLPGCCTDCPTVSERCTLFGRGAITYCWSCGFSATFRFTAHGDVIVTYRS